MAVVRVTQWVAAQFPSQEGGGWPRYEMASIWAKSPLIKREDGSAHPIKCDGAPAPNEDSMSLRRAGAPNRDQVESRKYNSRF